MRKTVLFIGAATLLAGCVLPPDDVTEADLAAFDAAVASFGCDLVRKRHYLPVELQTGMSREKLIEVAQYRVALEQAQMVEGGGIRLITGQCAPTTQVAASGA